METDIILILLILVCLHAASIIAFNVYFLCVYLRGEKESRLAHIRRTRRRGVCVHQDNLCRILVTYHVVLLMAEVLLAIACQAINAIDYQLDTGDHLSTLLWIFSAVNYCMLLYVAYIIPTLFACVNFILFWGSLTLMITCSEVDCSGLPTGLENLSRGWAAILTVFAYAVMLVEACYMQKTVLGPFTVRSKREAVNEMTRRGNEQPKVTWSIFSGYWKGGLRTRHFVSSHEASQDYFFDNTKNWEATVTPLGPPWTNLFHRTNTKLTIKVTSYAGDEQTENQLVEETRRFERRNKTQNYSLTVTTCFTDDYFVTDGFVPQRFKSRWYWLFTLLGLSLFYRCYLYYSVGHITCTIEKVVFHEDSVPQQV